MASLSISPQLAPPPFSSSSSSLSSSSSSSQSPSKTYTYQYDCSYGLCTFDCPQWCILPPPPPLFLTTDNDGATSSSSSHISPLMAALIAVLAASFCLLCYFTVFSKFFRNRRNNSTRNSSSSSPFIGSLSSARLDPLVRGSGLDEAYIRQITVFKYNKEDKIVDSIECAVCLSEFNEGENLRLMPNCQHAFHIPCIDTWLLTHSNCPLCRSTMSPLPVAVTASAATTATDVRSLGSNINYSNPSTLTNGNSNNNSVSVAAMRVERRSNDVVLVVREVDNRVQVVEPAQGVGLVRSENLDERESKLQVVNDNNVT